MLHILGLEDNAPLYNMSQPHSNLKGLGQLKIFPQDTGDVKMFQM